MHLWNMIIKEKKKNVFQKHKNLEMIIQKNYQIFMNQKYHFSKNLQCLINLINFKYINYIIYKKTNFKNFIVKFKNKLLSIFIINSFLFLY